MSSTLTEMDGSSSHEMAKKGNRREELRQARKMIDTLQARHDHAAPTSGDDLKEFTAILSTVVNVLTSLEMQDSGDDSGTAATIPETVGSTSDNDDECHAGVTRLLDDSYEADEQQSHYEEESRKVHKRKHKRKEERQESFSDYVIDDDDEDFQALSGYEDGFNPPADVDLDASGNDSVAAPTVSVLGFDTPTTRRTKGTASIISEESVCFYCQMHGNEGGCQGTRFCC